MIVCTRDRGDNVVPTARAILKNDYPNFELLIVDQSADELTAQAVAPLCAKDSRVRHVKSPPSGQSAGVNIGSAVAQGEFLAMTDDDCEPDSRWLSAMVEGFQLEPKIGCIFGDVIPGPHDPTKGYIPAVRTFEPRFVYRLHDYVRIPGRVHTGMGANMAVRAEVLAKMQGFDPCLSPGGRFNNGGESDLAARMLVAGYVIYFSPDAKVTHFGFRELHRLADDFRRWGRPRGAAFAKHLRLGVFYRSPVVYLWFHVKDVLRSTYHLRRPPQESVCIPAWFGGFFAGLAQPLDRQKKQFRPKASGKPTEDLTQVTLRNQIPLQKD